MEKKEDHVPVAEGGMVLKEKPAGEKKELPLGVSTKVPRKPDLN